MNTIEAAKKYEEIQKEIDTQCTDENGYLDVSKFQEYQGESVKYDLVYIINILLPKHEDVKNIISFQKWYSDKENIELPIFNYDSITEGRIELDPGGIIVIIPGDDNYIFSSGGCNIEFKYNNIYERYQRDSTGNFVKQGR